MIRFKPLFVIFLVYFSFGDHSNSDSLNDTLSIYKNRFISPSFLPGEIINQRYFKPKIPSVQKNEILKNTYNNFFRYNPFSFKQKTDFRFLYLTSEYRYFYPSPYDISYSKMERVETPTEYGMKLTLENSIDMFTHYEIRNVLSKNIEKQTNNDLTFVFPKDAHTILSTKIYVRAVGVYEKSEEKSIMVNFYPQAIYQANGYTASGYIIVKNSEIPYHPYTVSSSWNSNYFSIQPSDSDKQFAQQEWGRILTGLAGIDEIQKLCEQIVTTLDVSRRGTPSDEMNALSPFEQYRWAVARKSHVWCGNIAKIFCYACACFNIPVRFIEMGNWVDWTQAPFLLNNEGHSTTEVFDDVQKKWVLMDLTFDMLSIYYKENWNKTPLTVIELQYLLQSKEAIDKIYLKEFDENKNRVVDIPLKKSKNYDLYFNFYKIDQKMQY